MEQQFPTPEPVELHVRLDSGSAEVTARETTESSVRITGPRAEEFTVEHRGNHLLVVAPKDRGGFFGKNSDHRVEVTVPTGSSLAGKTGSADVTATGEYDAVRVKTGSGDIELERAAGPAVLETGSGEIACHDAGSELRIKSGSGDVEIGQVGGTTAISTGSGDVLLGRTAEPTVVKSGSGDVSVTRCAAELTMNTGSGNLRVEHLERGEIRAKSASGDVRLGIPEGVPVWTDLNSVTGRIVSDLAPVGKPAQGQDHLRIQARTVSGDVVLAQI